MPYKDPEKAKTYRKSYREQNKTEIATRMKSYYEQNKSKVASQVKAYYEENKAEIASYRKSYYEQNKSKVASQVKAYYEENKAEIASYRKAYRKVWYEQNKTLGVCVRVGCGQPAIEDQTLCVACNEINCARTVIRKAVQGKKSARTEEIVGCSLEELRSHLRSTLPEGVTDPTGYHIDHIIPVASAQGVRWKRYAVNHYTNLRYLWGPENIAKSDDHDPKDAEAYFAKMEPLYLHLGD